MGTFYPVFLSWSAVFCDKQNEYLFMINLEQTSFCVFLCGLDKSSKRVKKICLKMTANNSSIPEPAGTNSTKSIKLKEHIKKQKGVM